MDPGVRKPMKLVRLRLRPSGSMIERSATRSSPQAKELNEERDEPARVRRGPRSRQRPVRVPHAVMLSISVLVSRFRMLVAALTTFSILGAASCGISTTAERVGVEPLQSPGQLSKLEQARLHLEHLILSCRRTARSITISGRSLAPKAYRCAKDLHRSAFRTRSSANACRRITRVAGSSRAAHTRSGLRGKT